jgi:hypothetical protein
MTAAAVAAMIWGCGGSATERTASAPVLAAPPAGTEVAAMKVSIEYCGG